MSRMVRVTTPSRLHYGLLRFSQQSGPSFGGLGMMIDQPRYVLEFSINHEFTVKGPHAERVSKFANRVLDDSKLLDEQSISINILEAPPSHTGLGTGTQLALAVATGILELSESPINDIAALSQIVGRGARSAVGSHGFKSGGLIWETGYIEQESLGQLSSRLDFPHEWRILLIRPEGIEGKSGPDESSAFSNLPSVPTNVTESLIQIAEHEILPAVVAKDFTKFSEALFQYGYLAGNCFASLQGGPYASKQIHDRINLFREIGISGVGQSSWGPTIFAMCSSEDEAQITKTQISQHELFSDCALMVVAPNNKGAKIEKIVEEVQL